MKNRALSIRNLSVCVGGTQVVSGATLRVAPGEVHVIVGPNGSGKSSLLNALMGHPSYVSIRGSMSIGKKSLTALSPHQRAHLGLFLSLQHIPEINGITLIYFLHRIHKEMTGEQIPILDFYARARKIVRQAGMNTALLKRPLNTGLSGGEKKQSEIIQLLVLRPSFALLDEIDSGVDMDALSFVQRGIRALQKEGAGILVVTHHPHLLLKLKPRKVHVMKEGRIIESGSTVLARKIMRTGFAEA